MTNTDFTARRQAFEDAWVDLGDRLTRAVATLADLIQIAPDPFRLTRKGEGLAQAQALWTDLNPGQGGDYAGAWRIFTDRIVALVEAEPDSGVREGLALAASYQRGYGDQIDAPPLHALVR